MKRSEEGQGGEREPEDEEETNKKAVNMIKEDKNFKKLFHHLMPKKYDFP